jgi:hypothetical protein
MSESNTSTGARVGQVAAGLAHTDRHVPVRDSRHEAMGVLIGESPRCTVTFTDGGLTQVAHHESSPDGLTWSSSMEVALRKSA